jgi:hypothetical protein
MATFYKYQERDIDSQVNWADIGLGMSDMITDQVATRKAKKEAYDDEVRAFNQYLDEHPTGDDENLASWTSAYSSDMQKKMLENQRAFKNGMISERDNVTFTQNVKDGTKTIFDLSTEYQAEYKDKMLRINSTDLLNKSQELESFLMEQPESYDNYKTSKPIIDPKTGLVLLSMKKKDGTYETVSAANLRNRMKVKVDYFDSNGATTKIETEGLGEEVISNYAEAKNALSTGVITEESFKLLKDGFETALREQVSSYLVAPTNVSSVLTNDILYEDILDKDGKVTGRKPVNYSFTYDKAEAAADPYKILLVVKGGGSGVPTPDFSTANGEKQQEVVLGYMTRQTIEKVDRKVSQQVIGALGYKPVTPPNPYYTQRSDQRQDVDNSIKTWAENFTNMMYGTDESTANNGTQYTSGGFGASGGVGTTKVGTKLYQRDAAGNLKTFDFSGPNNRAALIGVVQANGVPIQYQDKTVDMLIKLQAGRTPNAYNTAADAKNANVVTPTDQYNTGAGSLLPSFVKDAMKKK